MTSLKDVKVTSPKTATLTCEITPGDPKPTIQWFKGGREVKTSRKHVMTYDAQVASLVVKDTAIDDDATYMCRADNQVGQAETEAKLQVIGTAPIRITSSSTCTLLKDPSSVGCIVRF